MTMHEINPRRILLLLLRQGDGMQRACVNSKMAGRIVRLRCRRPPTNELDERGRQTTTDDQIAAGCCLLPLMISMPMINATHPTTRGKTTTKWLAAQRHQQHWQQQQQQQRRRRRVEDDD
jgi:hypothetical protein